MPIPPFAAVPGWLGELLTLFAGPLGLVVVFVYSFLVAFVLPFAGEVVPFVPVDLGISRRGELAAIVVASSVGKALGSLVAMRVEDGARNASSASRRRTATSA